MKQSSAPYLSVVATTRNDDHGGNLHRRTQIFINGLLKQCWRHQLQAELILVEWNPPRDKPRLVEDFEWPAENGPCSVRIIEVPSTIHKRFKYSDQLPLFQYIAKNVGIRRARGDFILATNIDLLFSDELMAYFSTDTLSRGEFYRADRYDVRSDVPLEASTEEQLEFCRNHVIRIYERDGIRGLVTQEYKATDITLMALLKSLGSTIQSRERRKIFFQPQWYRNKFAVLRRLLFAWRYKHTPLHLAACGDFQLMAREHWTELRSYPEFEMYSFHIDSLFSYMAHYSSLKEHVLDAPIYHIDHSGGWTLEVEKNKTLERYLSKVSVPQLSYEELTQMVTEMRRKNCPSIFNSEKWGLGDEDLLETIVYESAAT